MPPFTGGPYRNDADLRPLIAFVQELARNDPAATRYYHPGDVVWQLHAMARSDDVRIWRNGGRIAAFAIFEPPLTFQFECDPRAGDLFSEILRWAGERRAQTGTAGDVPIAYAMLGEQTLSVSAFESDAERIRALVHAGYTRAERHSIRFERSLLDAIPDPPHGVRFPHIGEAELPGRVDLHRHAWSVWGTSSFNITAYRQLRAAPLYNAGLDVVLEHEGQMLSYCICWVDEVNGVGYFEPVGTRPSAAGKGFGRAVMHEGLRRLRDRGMSIARVGTASVNPGAAALYASSGFAVVDREHFWVLEMHQ